MQGTHTTTSCNLAPSSWDGCYLPCCFDIFAFPGELYEHNLLHLITSLANWFSLYFVSGAALCLFRFLYFLFSFSSLLHREVEIANQVDIYIGDVLVRFRFQAQIPSVELGSWIFFLSLKLALAVLYLFPYAALLFSLFSFTISKFLHAFVFGIFSQVIVFRLYT